MYFLGVGTLSSVNDRTICPFFSLDMAMSPTEAILKHMLVER